MNLSSSFNSQVDEDLSFLDSFVNAALSSGAKPYNPPDLDEEIEIEHRRPSLKSGVARFLYTYIDVLRFLFIFLPLLSCN